VCRVDRLQLRLGGQCWIKRVMKAHSTAIFRVVGKPVCQRFLVRAGGSHPRKWAGMCLPLLTFNISCSSRVLFRGGEGSLVKSMLSILSALATSESSHLSSCRRGREGQDEQQSTWFAPQRLHTSENCAGILKAKPLPFTETENFESKISLQKHTTMGTTFGRVLR